MLVVLSRGCQLRLVLGPHAGKLRDQCRDLALRRTRAYARVCSSGSITEVTTVLDWPLATR